MQDLDNCQNEEDPVINEVARVAKRFLPVYQSYQSMGIFRDAKGQLTLQYMIRSGRISDSVETLWLCSLPARMKNI